MTVNPGKSSPVDWTQLSPDLTEKLQHAYLGTFRGPHGDAPHTDVDSADTGALKKPAGADAVLTALLAAHYRLAGTARSAKPVSRCTPPMHPVGSVRRCRSSPTTARC